MKRLPFILVLLLGACATSKPAELRTSDQFFARMTALCGKSFAGKLLAGDATDTVFASSPLFAHGRKCSDSEIQIAFDVGEDRTRTWIVTRTKTGLRLKHKHMLKDGREDPVSQYGGDSVTPGTAERQEFPADAFSKELFTREGRQISISNIWAFEIEEGKTITYELARPNRLFRVQFDFTKPVQVPVP